MPATNSRYQREVPTKFCLAVYRTTGPWFFLPVHESAPLASVVVNALSQPVSWACALGSPSWLCHKFGAGRVPMPLGDDPTRQRTPLRSRGRMLSVDGRDDRVRGKDVVWC